MKHVLLITILALAQTTAVSQAGRPDKQGYVTTDDGVKLYYRRIGSGSEVVIIPLGFMLSPAFDRLARGRTVIYYDMRNRGRSDAVADETRITIHDDVRDLERIRRHFDLDKISLIGESYLGLMVVMYAGQYPQHVDRLVQIGAVPRKFGTEYPAHLTMNDLERIFDAGEETRLRKLRDDGYHRSQPADYCRREWKQLRRMLVADPADAHKAGDGYCDLSNEWPINLERHLRHHFGSVRKLEISKEEIARVTHPVLTIHGTSDRNAPYGGGREWALTLPNARLVTIENAAHLPWIEAPELVFSSIDTFLKGGWPARAERLTSLDK